MLPFHYYRESAIKHISSNMYPLLFCILINFLQLGHLHSFKNGHLMAPSHRRASLVEPSPSEPDKLEEYWRGKEKFIYSEVKDIHFTFK